MAGRWFSWPQRSAAPVQAPDEAKASRTGTLVALSRGGQPVWTPRDYAALAREGFAKNPVVFRSVRLVAEAAASVPWLVGEADAHPALDLMARPNGRQGGADFLEAVVGHLMVSGNAYVEAVAVDGRVRELHALRPDRMRVVAGADGWPVAYDYSVNGRSVQFRQDAAGDKGGPLPPILHVANFHPLDDHYGFAPLEAALTSLDVHNAAAAWNKALLDNSARPSGALVYSVGGGNLSDAQFERLKRELEDGYQGARNAGRPLLLEGGLDWKTMALTPKEMDFIEAKNGAAREIALAFGVPPMLLGIPGDNTYANYQEANRAFWRQTVVPLVGRLAGAFGHWLLPAFGEAARFVPDLDQVPALAADRDGLWARVGAAGFLDDDEKRAAVGYGARRG